MTIPGLTASARALLLPDFVRCLCRSQRFRFSRRMCFLNDAIFSFLAMAHSFHVVFLYIFLAPALPYLFFADL